MIKRIYDGMRYGADDGGVGAAVADAPEADTSVLGGGSLTPAEPVSDGGTASQGGSKKLGDWRDGVKGDLKFNETLGSFSNPTEVAEFIIKAKEQLSSAVVKPGENATDEEVKAYRAAMGIPEAPDKYSIAETVKGDAVATATLTAMHKHGISDTQASEIVKAHADAVTAEITKANKAASAALKELWGDDMKANVEKAQKAVAVIGGKELASWLKLDMKGIEAGNNIHLVRAFHAIAERLGEDGMAKEYKGKGGAKLMPDGTKMLHFKS